MIAIIQNFNWTRYIEQTRDLLPSAGARAASRSLFRAQILQSNINTYCILRDTIMVFASKLRVWRMKWNVCQKITKRKRNIFVIFILQCCYFDIVIYQIEPINHIWLRPPYVKYCVFQGPKYFHLVTFYFLAIFAERRQSLRKKFTQEQISIRNL